MKLFKFTEEHRALYEGLKVTLNFNQLPEDEDVMLLIELLPKLEGVPVEYLVHFLPILDFNTMVENKLVTSEFMKDATKSIVASLMRGIDTPLEYLMYVQENFSDEDKLQILNGLFGAFNRLVEKTMEVEDLSSTLLTRQRINMSLYKLTNIFPLEIATYTFDQVLIGHPYVLQGVHNGKCDFDAEYSEMIAEVLEIIIASRLPIVDNFVNYFISGRMPYVKPEEEVIHQ